VLPGTRELAGVELALANEVGRESVLREVLETVDHELVVIDTPSNLGLLTVNDLVAADVVVAPVAAGDEGAAELRATIAKLCRVRTTVPELVVVITKVRPRRVMGDVIDDAITGLGLQTVARVPDRTAVEQADVARTPITLAAPDSAVALAYGQLADHLENRAVIA
jgi:chromosome partitioning protein